MRKGKIEEGEVEKEDGGKGVRRTTLIENDLQNKNTKYRIQLRKV